MKGRMSARKLVPGEKADPTYPKCEWGCGTTVRNSPYRTPIAGIPGGRYIVCGPDCPNRPGSVQVITTNDWRNE